MSGLGFLFARARRYWAELFLIGVLAAAQSAATLAVPWFGGRLLGTVVSGEGVPSGAVPLLLLVTLGGMTLFAAFSAIQSANTSAAILADLRRDAYDHVMALPIAFHDRERQGELLSLITYEVSSLSSFLSSTLATAPAMVLTAAGALVALFVLDPALALAIPVLIPAFVIGIRLAGRRMRHMAHENRRAEVGVITEAEEQLGMVHAIKAFAVEDVQAARYRDRVASALRRRRELALVSSTIGPAIGFAAGCAEVGAGPRPV